jgi:trimeric autotransporter adhesin
MSIATWNWKSQDASIRHMGPMAQDFHAAFGLGETDKGISTMDADGVALAAIQGMHQELMER